MTLKLNSNIVSGIVFLILSSLILFLMPQQIVLMQESSVNAQSIPKLISMVMLVCSVLLLIQGIFFTEKKEVSINKESIRKEFRGITMIGIFIGYALLIEKAGFLISSLLLCIVCLLFFKIRDWRYYASTFVVVFIVYYAFAVALNVNLP